jgi:transposase-like protein
MKIKCPNCISENLDQGISDEILCHDCKRTWKMVGTWRAPLEKDLEDLV